MIVINKELESKKRAVKLFESKDIEKIEVGTTKGLMEIHKYLFHDLEGFDAGKIRTVNMSKGNFRFANCLYLDKILEVIDKLPESTFDEIITKYIEMNVAHPFIEGNGRATRIWLDLILKKNLNKCIDWSKVDREDYLDFMILSPVKPKFITGLLREALTDDINSREIFMKGLDKSYEYENIFIKSAEKLKDDYKKDYDLER